MQLTKEVPQLGLCQTKNWVKRGCRKDVAREMVLLFSDRNPASTVKVDWTHWKAYLKNLACRCAAEAIRQNLQFFALQFYGECWAKNGSVEELSPRYPVDTKGRCVGESFKPCKNEKTNSLCVGRAFRAYFYTLKKSTVPYTHMGGVGYGCQRAVDVALVIDTSGSVTQVNFNKVIQFLKLFVERFDFPDSGTRFALLRFDHHVCIEITLEDSTLYTLHQLKNRIARMPYTGGATLTQLALREVKEKIFNGAARKGVPRTCILITDGKTFGDSEEVKKPSKELRAKGVHMIAIGVGDEVNRQELCYIAGNYKRVLMLESFEEVLVKAHKIIDKLTRDACEKV